jgi:hypothetical protein
MTTKFIDAYQHLKQDSYKDENITIQRNNQILLIE